MTTKFNPGDKVWAIVNDRVQEAVVETITIGKSTLVGYSPVAHYHLVCGNFRTTKTESEIAGTKQDLLESL